MTLAFCSKCAIAGLLPYRSGSLTVEGIDMAGVPAHAFCKRGIALVPEGRRLFTTLTVEACAHAQETRHQPGSGGTPEARMGQRRRVFQRRADHLDGTLAAREHLTTRQG